MSSRSCGVVSRACVVVVLSIACWSRTVGQWPWVCRVVLCLEQVTWCGVVSSSCVVWCSVYSTWCVVCGGVVSIACWSRTVGQWPWVCRQSAAAAAAAAAGDDVGVTSRLLTLLTRDTWCAVDVGERATDQTETTTTTAPHSNLAHETLPAA